MDSMCRQLNFDEDVDSTVDEFNSNLTEKQLKIIRYIDKAFQKWEDDIKERYGNKNQDRMPNATKRRKPTTKAKGAKKKKVHEEPIQLSQEISNEEGWGDEDISNAQFVNKNDAPTNDVDTEDDGSLNNMNLEEQLVQEGNIGQCNEVGIEDVVDMNTEVALDHESPTLVSDISNMSRQDLVSTIERLQGDIERLKAGETVKKEKKKKKPKAESRLDKMLIRDVTCVLRSDVIHKITNQPKNWELYSSHPSSMCQIIMRQMDSWPAGWDEKKKEEKWNALLGPNLNRRWCLVKNEVVQKIRHLFNRECSVCCNSLLFVSNIWFHIS